MIEFARIHDPHRTETRLRAANFLEGQLERASYEEWKEIKQRIALLKQERRDLAAEPTPWTAKSAPRLDTNEKSFQGHAAIFDSPSLDLGGFTEIIKPGAFTEALRNSRDVKFLLNHNRDLLLGRSSAGTLTLTQDERGLRFRADIADTTLARDVASQVNRGDLSQCSFGFVVGKDSFANTKTGVVRTIESFKLLTDVSVVVDPAYIATRVSIRSREQIDREETQNCFAKLDELNRKHPGGRLTVDAAERQIKLLELKHSPTL